MENQIKLNYLELKIQEPKNGPLTFKMKYLLDKKNILKMDKIKNVYIDNIDENEEKKSSSNFIEEWLEMIDYKLAKLI